MAEEGLFAWVEHKGDANSPAPGTHFVLSGQADLSTLLEEPPEDERRYTL